MKQSDLVRKLMLSRLRILNNFGFYGLLLMQMEYGLDDECDTAYTDGRKICFASSFLAKLSNQEVDFVLMHEILHVVFKHCNRGLKYNQHLFNIACDIVVNSNILLANNMDLNSISVNGIPSMHLTPKKDEGHQYTAEQVYEMLVNNLIETGDPFDDGRSKKNKKGEGEGLDGQSLDSFDDHSKWEELSEEEKQDLDQKINEAIELASERKNTGSVPGNLLREFNNLKKPKISWKELINDLLSFEVCDYSFSPPDKRYDMDFFLPDFNEYEYKEEEIYCFIDTSGSVTKEELTTIVSEINGALIQYCGKIVFKICYFDTEIYEDITVTDTKDLLKLKPKGNGGTNFHNIFKYINKLPDTPKGVVILTDGYAEFPKTDYSKEYPVIWLISSHIVPPWGRYAKIKV